MAFASGEQTGLLLSIALAFEVLILSLSVGAALTGAGLGRARTLAVPVGVALLLTLRTIARRSHRRWSRTRRYLDLLSCAGAPQACASSRHGKVELFFAMRLNYCDKFARENPCTSTEHET